MSREETEFQTKYDLLADKVIPEDFNIPPELMNEYNLPMW